MLLSILLGELFLFNQSIIIAIVIMNQHNRCSSFSDFIVILHFFHRAFP